MSIEWLMILALTVVSAASLAEKQLGRPLAVGIAVTTTLLAVLILLIKGGAETSSCPWVSHPDVSPTEKFLSGEETQISNVYRMKDGLHAEIKLWATKHFPPEKQDAAYRCMAREVMQQKMKLKMPASLAPYFDSGKPPANATAYNPETAPPSE